MILPFQVMPQRFLDAQLPNGTIPLACYPCLSSSKAPYLWPAIPVFQVVKHHAVCMEKVGLDLMPLREHRLPKAHQTWRNEGCLRWGTATRRCTSATTCTVGCHGTRQPWPSSRTTAASTCVAVHFMSQPDWPSEQCMSRSARHLRKRTGLQSRAPAAVVYAPW